MRFYVIAASISLCACGVIEIKPGWTEPPDPAVARHSAAIDSASGDFTEEPIEIAEAAGFGNTIRIGGRFSSPFVFRLNLFQPQRTSCLRQTVQAGLCYVMCHAPVLFLGKYLYLKLSKFFQYCFEIL